MTTVTLSRVRRSVLPAIGDTWASIAARELLSTNSDEAIAKLQSWNMHVFMRPAAPANSPRHGNPILPSDVIFIEPPLAI